MDKIALASQALTLVGHPPIATFTGPSSGQIAAATLYEDTVLEVLSLHRWSFAKKAVQLARLAAAPLTEWEAAYTLPPEASIIHGVEINQCPIYFDRYGGEIHCNAQPTDVVVLVMGTRPPEAQWPPYFVATIKAKLASVFAVPVAEDTQKAAFYEQKFMRQLTAAKLVDSQGRTASKMAGVGGLARYHRGRP